MADQITLWSTMEQSPETFYLLPDSAVYQPGGLRIREIGGRIRSVDPICLRPFEVTEEQARRWAMGELGDALGEIRESVDNKIAGWRRHLADATQSPATITADGASALLDLLKQLPSVVQKSLSGNECRIVEARDIMSELHRCLKDAGMDLGERFTGFPDRLASLRNDAEKERAARRQKDAPPSDAK